MSTLIHEYGKFYIEKQTERVGIVMYGVIFWYLLGLASEIMIVKRIKKKYKKLPASIKNHPIKYPPIYDHSSNDNNNINNNNNNNNNINDNNNINNGSIDDNNINNSNNNSNNNINNSSINSNSNINNDLIESKNEYTDMPEAFYDTDEENTHFDDTGIDNFVQQFNDVITPGGQLHRPENGAAEPMEDEYYNDLPDYNLQSKPHLVHDGGLSLRDFFVYWPCFIFATGWSGGAFDEGHEEACLCFQCWMKIRKQLMTRVPFKEVMTLHNKRGYLCRVCKSKGNEKSKYIKDTRFIMRELHIHYSIIGLSPRLVPAIKMAFTVMNEIVEERKREHTDDNNNELIENVLKYFTFYTNGSFIVHCSLNPKEQDPIIVATGPISKQPTEKCSYSVWEKVADSLQKQALVQAECNEGGWHV